MPPNRYCHFCGRSDSLHPIPETTKYVCSLCWEIIIHIVTRWKEVTEQVVLDLDNEQTN